MDLGDTIDAVGAPLQKGCKEETFAALAADIQRYTADAAQLTKEIAELDEDISIWQMYYGMERRSAQISTTTSATGKAHHATKAYTSAPKSSAAADLVA